ncbi:MAG: 30S ribosomal protein S16 [Gammaproteobacteria bacterium]|nr:30S ribosomal protein S16 [Gammaproteobacteria bacterium]
MVTVRLARAGTKNRPFYHIVVADSRCKRDGRHIERIGFYNPIATVKEQACSIDRARLAHWLARGAQASERVAHLIKKFPATEAAA